MPEPYTGPLPTISHYRGHGVKAIRVYCEGLYCGHSGEVLLDRLAFAADLPIIHVPGHRRFVCTRCGCRTVNVRAVWPPARGAGVPLD
jgi:hypothetical protein